MCQDPIESVPSFNVFWGKYSWFFARKERSKSTLQFFTVFILHCFPDRLKIAIFLFLIYVWNLWGSQWKTISSIICVSRKEVRGHLVQSLSRWGSWGSKIFCAQRRTHLSCMRWHRINIGFFCCCCCPLSELYILSLMPVFRCIGLYYLWLQNFWIGHTSVEPWMCQMPGRRGNLNFIYRLLSYFSFTICTEKVSLWISFLVYHFPVKRV